ncbi:unnamed protein product [Musa acuminata subsp. malaccensis]|uniref:(wild Malaysian banana) hypothetical protein n=1 Tax=Musa acuminata subsp. malaccensis TaxID=214687 RepID=A0A804KLS7_MUSAM|nr:unnamed protein product [Musa acuminata subsp. malaccensis]
MLCIRCLCLKTYIKYSIFSAMHSGLLFIRSSKVNLFSLIVEHFVCSCRVSRIDNLYLIKWCFCLVCPF